MAEHVWSVLCQKAPIDDASNEINLLGVIEQLTLTKAPPESGTSVFLPMPVVLVSLWSRSNAETPEETVCRYRLKPPRGKTLLLGLSGGSEVKVDLLDAPRARLILRLEGLPYSGLGQYLFKVETTRGKTGRWSTVAKVPFQITVEDEAASG